MAFFCCAVQKLRISSAAGARFGDRNPSFAALKTEVIRKWIRMRSSHVTAFTIRDSSVYSLCSGLLSPIVCGDGFRCPRHVGHCSRCLHVTRLQRAIRQVQRANCPACTGTGGNSQLPVWISTFLKRVALRFLCSFLDSLTLTITSSRGKRGYWCVVTGYSLLSNRVITDSRVPAPSSCLWPTFFFLFSGFFLFYVFFLLFTGFSSLFPHFVSSASDSTAATSSNSSWVSLTNAHWPGRMPAKCVHEHMAFHRRK